MREKDDVHIMVIEVEEVMQEVTDVQNIEVHDDGLYGEMDEIEVMYQM